MLIDNQLSRNGVAVAVQVSGVQRSLLPWLCLHDTNVMNATLSAQPYFHVHTPVEEISPIFRAQDPSQDVSSPRGPLSGVILSICKCPPP